MALLIKGGEIITADSRSHCDIFIEDETISRIGVNLDVPPEAEVIDATGKLVFPGFIDPHVHIHLPFMATFAKDTHATASKAALIGGTTTFIEMCCPSRNEDALEGYNTWKQKAEGNSACDYAFHMAVTRYDEKTEAQLREIVRDGTASFKIFLAYKNFFGVTDEEMFYTLKLAAELGVITTAHCENAELVGQLQQLLLGEGKTGPELRGVKLYVESVLPHLLLDKSYAERPGVDGMKHVMSPPLRAKHNLPVLWDALQVGLIDTVGTDHCPFDKEQKLLGANAFTQIPNGIAGIEDRVNLMYTYGVKRGGLSIHRFVDALSTRPAQLFGLFPRKGTIAVGSDADLVIYDITYRGTISATTQHTNNDYNGFEGFAIEGRPSVVTVRGKVQVRDGFFVGEPARGRMIRRKPQYYAQGASHAD